MKTQLTTILTMLAFTVGGLLVAHEGGVHKKPHCLSCCHGEHCCAKCKDDKKCAPCCDKK